jgi:hypothetical protein
LECGSPQAVFLPVSDLFLEIAQGIKMASVGGMNAKSLLVVALAGAAFGSALLAPTRSNGQAAADDPALTVLLNDVTVQQTTLAENQARIDAKLASIGENLRLARIFVGRGGGKVP